MSPDDAQATTDPLERLAHAIEAQLGLLSPRAEVVAEACAALGPALAAANDPDHAQAVAVRLAARLRTVRGDIAAPLSEALLAWLDAGAADPAGLAAELLAARDPSVQRQALAAVTTTWPARELALPAELARQLASAVASALPDRDPVAADQALLDQVATLVGRHTEGADQASDPREALLCRGASEDLRRLAARSLDHAGGPLPEARLVRVLGSGAADRLGALLQYTRATHQDLVSLTPAGALSDALVQQLCDAGDQLGPTALGAVIGELGWAAVCRGISVEHRLGLSVDGSYPFAVTPAEAALLEGTGTVRQLWDRHLVVAHGGGRSTTGDGDPETAAVRRFRRYNLLHAEVLGEIMEIAPVTPAKVRRIVDDLDEVVSIYTELFADQVDDVASIDERYQRLRVPLLDNLAGMPDDQPLDAEATRLVQMFEDPRHIGEVTTLHGLKRYLHQHGLSLAFQRFRSGAAANCTVDLAVVAGDRVVQTVRKIRYIDFEPPAATHSLPFIAALMVEAMGRRLLHLHGEGPDLELLIYGNEVQAFVRFRNHPAFLRIDSSPPLRGGMIDLVYFGVSQFELDHHPDLRLLWIQRIFRRLDFGARAEGLRLHIRYDKERAFDFADLVDRIRLLCSLLPHLMDLDWVLGGLRYPEPVLAAIADHWADWIARWGVLPIEDMLTRDRRALLQEVRSDAAGAVAVPWDGRGPVRHHLSGGPTAAFWDRLRDAIEAGPPPAPAIRWEAVRDAVPAQLTLQEHVLDALRLAPAMPTTVDAPLHMASLLGGAAGPLAAAVRTAAVVATVERHLRFATVGAIHGYPVRQATLLLPGEVLQVTSLHDAAGVVRLASAESRPLLLTPGSPGADAHRPPVLEAVDAEDLAGRLRRGNYVGITGETPQLGEPVDTAAVSDAFATANPQAPPPTYPGDRTLDGIAAAPGRATGIAVFYRPDLTPADVEHAVLFAPTLRPEDTPLLRHAAAVVSTGGGILSHAGMIALELGKPALLVQGVWQLGEASRPTLSCRTTDHTVESSRHGGLAVTVFRDRREREEQLREGDLVVVNADRGKLGILGQDRDALAIQEELRNHDAVAAALTTVAPGPDALALRGRLLRTAHQLEKLVTRIVQPNLVRHTARELLAPRRTAAARSRRADLLRRLLANPQSGEVAREASVREEADLSQHLQAQCAAGQRAMAAAETIGEVLFLQQAVERAAAALHDMRATLVEAGVDLPADATDHCRLLDQQCRQRLLDLRDRIVADLGEAADDPDHWWRARSGLQTTRILSDLLGEPVGGEQRARARTAVRSQEQRAQAHLAGRPIIMPTDGGLELTPLIGAKGAGLGEIARVLGPALVPAWFAVSDAAFREALAVGIGPVDSALKLAPGTPVMLAISSLLERTDLDLPARSAAIRAVWQSVVLPDHLVRAIAQAYDALAADDPSSDPAVAVRSSTFEEDSARSSWAGQFDTFLGVRGAEAVVEHVKLAWASLWSDRVLHHRRSLGGSEAVADLGGGVLVQRLVNSRAAGVAHTLSPVSGQPREMVLNAGLGLGEGVVSGTVEVDQVAITRTPGAMPTMLQFRYTVGDKRHQVVFDRRHGRGTCIEETLYHQRLRPALEYTDLQDLVHAATRLEVALGYPLDVEFALEADRLYVLQARPIVAFQAAVSAARERATGRPQEFPA